jgi:hypothetical protein
MSAIDRLRAANEKYSMLCPVPCADVHAALEAIACLQDLVREIDHRHLTDIRGTDFRQKPEFANAKACLDKLEKL